MKFKEIKKKISLELFLGIILILSLVARLYLLKNTSGFKLASDANLKFAYRTIFGEKAEFNCLKNPFYSFLLMFPLLIIKILGFSFGWIFEKSVRLVTVFFSLILILIVYLIGKELKDKTLGLLSAALLSLSPLFLKWSVQLSTEIASATFLMASFLLFFKKEHPWLAGILSGLAFLIRDQTILFLPFLIFLYLYKKRYGEVALFFFGGFLVLSLGGRLNLLFCNRPYGELRYHLRHISSLLHPSLPPTTIKKSIQAGLSKKAGEISFLKTFPILGYLSFLFVLKELKSFFKENKGILFTLIPLIFIPPLIIFLYKGATPERYLLMSLPFLSILSALFISKKKKAFQDILKPNKDKFLSFVLILLFLISIFQLLSLDFKKTSGYIQGIKEIGKMESQKVEVATSISKIGASFHTSKVKEIIGAYPQVWWNDKPYFKALLERANYLLYSNKYFPNSEFAEDVLYNKNYFLIEEYKGIGLYKRFEKLPIESFQTKLSFNSRPPNLIKGWYFPKKEKKSYIWGGGNDKESLIQLPLCSQRYKIKGGVGKLLPFPEKLTQEVNISFNEFQLKEIKLKENKWTNFTLNISKSMISSRNILKFEYDEVFVPSKNETWEKNFPWVELWLEKGEDNRQLGIAFDKLEVTPSRGCRKENLTTKIKTHFHGWNKLKESRGSVLNINKVLGKNKIVFKGAKGKIFLDFYIKPLYSPFSVFVLFNGDKIKEIEFDSTKWQKEILELNLSKKNDSVSFEFPGEVNCKDCLLVFATKPKIHRTNDFSAFFGRNLYPPIQGEERRWIKKEGGTIYIYNPYPSKKKIGFSLNPYSYLENRTAKFYFNGKLFDKLKVLKNPSFKHGWMLNLKPSLNKLRINSTEECSQHKNPRDLRCLSIGLKDMELKENLGFVEGWYIQKPAEQIKWMKQNGTIKIESSKREKVLLELDTKSFYKNREIQVYHNNKKIKKFKSFIQGNKVTFPVNLKKGANTLTFHSSSDCIIPSEISNSSDKRCLSMGFNNFSIVHLDQLKDEKIFYGENWYDKVQKEEYKWIRNNGTIFIYNPRNKTITRGFSTALFSYLKDRKVRILLNDEVIYNSKVSSNLSFKHGWMLNLKPSLNKLKIIATGECKIPEYPNDSRCLKIGFKGTQLKKKVVLAENWYPASEKEKVLDTIPCRWMKQNGRILIYNNFSKTVSKELRFFIKAFYNFQRIKIYLNGNYIKGSSVSPYLWGKKKLDLKLKPGRNIIKLKSRADCKIPKKVGGSNDIRCISIAIRNLALS